MTRTCHDEMYVVKDASFERVCLMHLLHFLEVQVRQFYWK